MNSGLDFPSGVHDSGRKFPAKFAGGNTVKFSIPCVDFTVHTSQKREDSRSGTRFEVIHERSVACMSSTCKRKNHGGAGEGGGGLV